MTAVKRRTSRNSDNAFLSILYRLWVILIMAGPFVLVGIYGFLEPQFPQGAAVAVFVVGIVLAVVGLYMTFTGIVPTPSLVEGEQLLAMRHPTMKPAIARMVVSIPIFLGAGYLFALTEVPYVFPFVVFIVGLYIFMQGAMRYLRNLHITYTVTNRRVIHLYKFLWLSTKEIPVSRITSISEARSFFEILTGRGSVVVASGIGDRHTVRIEEIDDPGKVAETLRSLLP